MNPWPLRCGCSVLTNWATKSHSWGHCTGIAELIGSNPVESLNFSGSWDNCLNCPASARIISSFDFFLSLVKILVLFPENLMPITEGIVPSSRWLNSAACHIRLQQSILWQTDPLLTCITLNFSVMMGQHPKSWSLLSTPPPTIFWMKWLHGNIIFENFKVTAHYRHAMNNNLSLLFVIFVLLGILTLNTLLLACDQNSCCHLLSVTLPLNQLSHWAALSKQQITADFWCICLLIYLVFLQAIGSRNLLKSIAKQREAQQQQLRALIAEKKTQLER